MGFKMNTSEFLNCLERQDIKTLSEKLDDKVPYFGASKKVFLERLQYIYKQNELAGGNGKDIKVKPNKKKTNAFRLHVFLKTSFKFIIEEKEGKISEITGEKPLKFYKGNEAPGPLSFSFGEDEMLGFTPDEKHLLTLCKCNEACIQIEAEGKNVLNKVDLSLWVMEHAALHWNTPYYYKGFERFKNLYSSLNNAENVSDKYPTAKMAMEIYDNAVQDDNFMVNWLNTFNRLYYCHTMDFLWHNEYEENEMRNRAFPGFDVFFEGEEFEVIKRFNAIYERESAAYT
jgi:hypothetical protein